MALGGDRGYTLQQAGKLALFWRASKEGLACVRAYLRQYTNYNNISVHRTCSLESGQLAVFSWDVFFLSNALPQMCLSLYMVWLVCQTFSYVQLLQPICIQLASPELSAE